MRIRGVTSISAGNRPLFIVDGIPVETGALAGRDFGGQSDNALALINPNDIESIEILKDASTKATRLRPITVWLHSPRGKMRSGRSVRCSARDAPCGVDL